MPPLPWMRPGCQAHLFSNTMFANAQCELPLKAPVQQFPLKRVGCICWGLLRNYPVAFKEWWRLFEFPHRARPRQAIFNLVLKIDNFHTKFGDSWEIRRPLRYVHTIIFICSGPFLIWPFPTKSFYMWPFSLPLMVQLQNYVSFWKRYFGKWLDIAPNVITNSVSVESFENINFTQG